MILRAALLLILFAARAWAENPVCPQTPNLACASGNPVTQDILTQWTIRGANPMKFEGTSVDANEITVSVGNPGSPVTLFVPGTDNTAVPLGAGPCGAGQAFTTFDAATGVLGCNTVVSSGGSVIVQENGVTQSTASTINFTDVNKVEDVVNESTVGTANVELSDYVLRAGRTTTANDFIISLSGAAGGKMTGSSAGSTSDLTLDSTNLAPNQNSNPASASNIFVEDVITAQPNMVETLGKFVQLLRFTRTLTYSAGTGGSNEFRFIDLEPVFTFNEAQNQLNYVLGGGTFTGTVDLSTMALKLFAATPIFQSGTAGAKLPSAEVFSDTSTWRATANDIGDWGGYTGVRLAPTIGTTGASARLDSAPVIGQNFDPTIGATPSGAATVLPTVVGLNVAGTFSETSGATTDITDRVGVRLNTPALSGTGAANITNNIAVDVQNQGTVAGSGIRASLVSRGDSQMRQEGQAIFGADQDVATAPDLKAAVEVQSTTRGLLPPRMSSGQKDTLNAPPITDGMLVYDTSEGNLQSKQLGSQQGPFIRHAGPTYREWGWQAAGGDINSYNQLGATPTSFGTTPTTANKAEGPYTKHTSNVSGSATGARTTSLATISGVEFQWGPILTVVMRTGDDAADIQNVRIWVGFSSVRYDTVMNGTADPVAHVAAFRFDTSADGTNFWRAYTNDGAGTGSATPTIASIASNTRYVLQIDMSDETSVKFYVNGTLVVTQVANLPGATADMGVGTMIVPLVNGDDKDLLVQKVWVEHD